MRRLHTARARARRALLITLLALPAGAHGAVGPPAIRWQELDADGDGRFDVADIDRMMRSGPNGQPSVDANADGKRDVADVWHMLGLLTRWDRDANGHVDGADALAAGTLRLPRPPARDSVARLALALAREYAGRIPDLSVLQATMNTTWQRPAPEDSAGVAGYYENVGLRALLVRNLDVATWAFAQSAARQPERATAVSNLGFVLIELGRHEDALGVLAHALELRPQSCAAHANIATVFARHRQGSDALRHYRAAAEACPNVGQYRLNVGAALMRMDSTAGALAQFRHAERLTPHDLEAQLMVWSIAPPKAPDMAEFGARWEKRRRHAAEELAREGADPAANPYQPWAEVSPMERVTFLLGDAADRAQEEYESAREGVRETTQRVTEALSAPFVQAEPSCGALKTWLGDFPDAAQKVLDVRADANRRLRSLDQVRRRRTATYQLALDPIILGLFLQEAQGRMSSSGRAGFVEVIDQYEALMEEIRRELKNAYGDAAFDIGEVDPDGYFNEAGESGARIMLGVFAQGRPCDVRAEEMQLKYETSLGADMLLAGVSYKPAECEVRIRAGQGLIAAGTWSPTAGFGFETGVGIEANIGPLAVGRGSYTRIGSDGSITDMTDRSAGVALPGITHVQQLGTSTPAFAAEHAPVGASPFLAGLLGCD